jgi:small-conductance mechanosensitive channel
MTWLSHSLETLVGAPLLARALLLVTLALLALGLSLLLPHWVVLAATRWLTPFETADDQKGHAQFKALTGPLRLLTFGIVLQLLAPSVLEASWAEPVSHAGLVAAIAAGGFSMMRLLRLFEHAALARLRHASADDFRARGRFTQLRGFHNIARFLSLVVTVALVLLSFDRVRQLGAGLLASAGVAGVVLGFAAQKSIATIVAGVQIAMTQPIRVDDIVVVEKEWGHIEEITLTYVVVRTWDLRRLIVPINYFIEKPFENWSRTSPELLGTVEVNVDYSTPVGVLRELSQRFIEESPLWDGKTCKLQVVRSDDRTMVVRSLFSARNASDLWDLRCEVREHLLTELQQRFPSALPKARSEEPQKQKGVELSGAVPPNPLS